MTQITLYHNPGCSKSRATLALLEAYQSNQQAELEVIEYLNNPPTTSQLATLVEQLGITAHELLRHKEAAYSAKGLSAALPATQLLQAITQAPILMERPIVVCAGKAAIGRPPEQVLNILPNAN